MYFIFYLPLSVFVVLSNRLCSMKISGNNCAAGRNGLQTLLDVSQSVTEDYATGSRLQCSSQTESVARNVCGSK